MFLGYEPGNDLISKTLVPRASVDLAWIKIH